MIQGNELIMLLLGVGVLIFMLVNRRRLAGVEGHGVLFATFAVLLVAWVFTVLEGCVFREVFNFLEHACYCVSSILLAVWCGRGFRGEETS